MFLLSCCQLIISYYHTTGINQLQQLVSSSELFVVVLSTQTLVGAVRETRISRLSRMKLDPLLMNLPSGQQHEAGCSRSPHLPVLLVNIGYISTPWLQGIIQHTKLLFTQQHPSADTDCMFVPTHRHLAPCAGT